MGTGAGYTTSYSEPQVGLLEMFRASASTASRSYE